ncbi:MAG TPA: T9SS type A sorting domain-containing protein, partial [Chitinophagaceae bacterium]|nr:T9SS type A sorting domain-containing protein [Chitinophagaceae bacterium]
MKKFLPFLFALLISNVCFAQTYINGSVVTGTSTYSGVTNPSAGYQWSETAYDAPNTTYSSGSAGFSCNRTSSNTGFRLADDFVIPAGEKWTINTVEFLAYQTGYAGVTSPFNEMYVEIWNGAPNVSGSTIVFGDMVTNRFSSSSEILAHRIFNTVAPAPGTTPGTTRRIWKTIANTNVTLCSGTYWVVFQTGINNASVYSSHFAPPVTLPNVRAVSGANALQYNESTSTWTQAIDAGNPATATDENIAIPFTVNYVDANPLTITASPSAAVCLGSNITLTAGGATLPYTWSGGISDGVPFQLNVNDTYTVSAVDGSGCNVTKSVAVTTIALPNVSASSTPTPASVCDGTSITLFGSGASAYTWAGPIAITDNTPFTVNATSAGTYTVTGTDAGCSSTATIIVSISAPSVITATVTPNDTVCAGIPITLSGAGGVSYAWNSNPTLTSDTTLIPSSAATYTVVGTDAGGCTGSATISISLANTPNFVDDFETGSLSPTWQSGTGSYTATVVNTNPAEGSYNLKLSSTTNNNFYQGRYVTFPSAQPTYVSWWAKTNTTTAANGYFVLGDNNIASNNGILFVYFNATSSLRFFNTTGYNYPIVANQWYFIEARNINWTTKTMDIYVDNVLILPGWAFRTPTATDVTQFHLHSLSASDPEYDRIQIGLGNMVPLAATVSPSSTVCAGSPISLHASGAMNYSWNGLSVPSGDTSLIPAASSIYTVTANDSYGCTASSNVSVTVTPTSGTIAPVTSNQSQQHGDDFSINYSDASCNLIATVDDGVGGNILGATTATVNVETTAGMHNNQPYVRRWYQITPTSNGSADVVLYINQSDFDDYNAMVTAPYLPLPTTGNNADPNIANIRITKNSDAGLGNAPVVITPTVNWNGNYWELSFNTPSFSQFRVHSVNPNNVPLPITLTQFKGRMVSSHDELTWTTKTEYQNDYFNLQHSTDGQHFTTIEKVMSKAVNGNSEQELNYVVNHTSPKAGHNYYRLQQVDRDGKLSTNAQVVDLYRSNSGSGVSIYPNPVKDVLHIELYASQSQKNTIKLIDMSGRLVKQLQVSSVSGVNNLELNLTDVASGVYTIEVYANDYMMQVSRIRKSN